MYHKVFKVKEDHIDFQGIVDGLYFPFYLEWTRHAFMRDIVGVDLAEAATKGDIYVLSEYNLKFKKPLKKDDELTVTCELIPAERSSRFKFNQSIMVNGKVHAEAVFTATCVRNGRPTVPEEVKSAMKR